MCRAFLHTSPPPPPLSPLLLFACSLHPPLPAPTPFLLLPISPHPPHFALLPVLYIPPCLLPPLPPLPLSLACFKPPPHPSPSLPTSLLPASSPSTPPPPPPFLACPRPSLCTLSSHTSQRPVGGAAVGTGTCGGCGMGGGGCVSAHLGGSSGNLGGTGGSNLGGSLNLGASGGGGVTIGSCGGYRMVNLHLSSMVLAAKSAFFRTLFTCGFKETCQNNPVVLNVSPEEENPVIDLLRFIYTGDMQEGSSDPEDIIKMYLVADKFGVASCMKICLERLVNLPMTVPTTCLYISLPESMHSHRGVAQLLEASWGFLMAHFRDLERVHKGEEFLELPLEGVQTLLASDELNVRDELTAFHAIVEWLRHHHDDLDDRKQAAVRLAEHVRFPLMTGDDPDDVAGSSASSRARAVSPHDDLEDVVLKAPEVDSPECQALALAVAATVESATFGIGGKRFYLSAWHGRWDDGTETLDIHLYLENSHSVQPEIQVSFIFYAKRWPEGQFDYLRDRITKGFGRNASNWGYSNILGRPWAEVVQDESKYLKNGVMSVFAEVQILEDAGRGPVVGG
ncbi:unnamed protein product [Closterium sp. NIES-64]|nr:unnamed protein product [Closterium sp. NIES-64]